jgi:Na+-transporting NADH:ubiquinone oxidoreductase subunit NqrC
MARVAVVSGTATAVSNRVSRRQAGRWSQQEQEQYEQQQAAQQQAPPAAAPAEDAMDTRIDQLKGLADLKAQGVLTDAEFEAQKAKILAG